MPKWFLQLARGWISGWIESLSLVWVGEDGVVGFVMAACGRIVVSVEIAGIK